MTNQMKLGIQVDTDTRATKQEFSSLRQLVKTEADKMGGDWEAAARKVEDALEEAGARTDLIDAARKIGEQGPSEIEKVKTALKETGDAARTLSDDIGDAAHDIKTSVEDSAITQDDIFGADLKAELVSNMVETGAEAVRGLKDGFDSEDASTILDGVTDAAASFGAMFGPAGAIGGLALGAVAQSVFGPFAEQAAEKAENTESSFKNMYDNILEYGANFATESTLQDNIQEITSDMERWAEAQNIAKTSGEGMTTVLRAMAGDADALKAVNDGLKTSQDDLNESSMAVSDQFESGKLTTQELQVKRLELEQKEKDLTSATDDLTTSYQGNKDGIEAAKGAADAMIESMNISAEKTIYAKEEAAKASGVMQTFSVDIDGVTRSFQALPDGKTIEVTDGGSVEVTKETIDGFSSYKAPTVSVPITPQTSGFWPGIHSYLSNQPAIPVRIRPVTSYDRNI